MRSFSVVLPIRNDSRFLPYSLPSIFKLKPDEVVLIFDRCTDSSLEVAKKITCAYGYESKTRIFGVKARVDEWRFQIACLRRLGFKLARHDCILNTDADMVLDENIRNYVSLLGHLAWISFEYLEYPVSFRNLLKRLFERVRLPFPWLSGVYLLNRKAWMETADGMEEKRLESGEDTWLHNAVRSKYRSRIVLTKTLHLRPRESSRRHYLRGRMYWSVAHRGLLTTILSGVFLFRPALIRGYIHERFGEVKRCC